MTNNQLTDERVTSVIERLEHYACNLKWTNVRGAQDLLAAADGLRELQERRKAAMDSEPVAEITEDLGRLFVKIHFPTTLKAGDKLYRHAQPAPVVSTDLFHTAASAIEDLLTTKDRAGAGVWFDLPFRLRSAANAQPAPVVPDELNTRTANDVMNEHLSWKDYGDAEVFCIAWNACRAAMLAAAPQSPGSEPAAVPGKWIPVSERMPESNGVYFGWDGKRVLEVNCFFGGFSANQFIHGEITHWMPLPAPPTEVS
ncbi:DUF551 domain-containing protein [Klebsiella pneumoniae]